MMWRFTYTYQHADGTAFLWIHVDDGLLVASSKALGATLKEGLLAALTIKWDQVLQSMVGIQIRKTPSGYSPRANPGHDSRTCYTVLHACHVMEHL
jgi:hypothetical protein